MSNNYGKELILDLYGCDIRKFTREHITRYFIELCELIKMERADMHFWDYEDEEEKNAAPVHLCGTTAVQFITTSNVTIHSLDKVGECFINIFSCKTFNPKAAQAFTVSFFGAQYSEVTVISRGRQTKSKI